MCLQLSCVQAWREFKLRLRLLWSARWYIKKKKHHKKKKNSVLVQTRHLRNGFMGSGIGVRSELGPSVSSFGFQRKEVFLFSVKTPCVGLVCSSSVISPFFFRLTQSIPTRPLPQVPTLAGCFGNLCHLCDPILRAHFWFEFCISIVENLRFPICVNIVDEYLLSHQSSHLTAS